MKYYELNAYGETFKVKVSRTKYCDNNTLAVLLTCDNGEPFGVITTNIHESTYAANNENAFVDTNNCFWAEKFLTENHLAEYANYRGCSGYCTYPLYHFNIDLIPEEL
jgi:hypothetical protein